MGVCEDTDGLKVCEDTDLGIDTDLGRFKNISAMSVSRKPIAKKISGQKCVKLCKMFCKVVVNRFEFYVKTFSKLVYQHIIVSAHLTNCGSKIRKYGIFVAQFYKKQ